MEAASPHQELQDSMIWEHIELYFRFYAKEIEKPKKRSKRTTNYAIVQTLIKDDHVKLILDTIFLQGKDVCLVLARLVANVFEVPLSRCLVPSSARRTLAPTRS